MKDNVNAQQIPYVQEEVLSVGFACGGGDHKYDANGFGSCAVGAQVSAFDKLNISITGSKGFGMATDMMTGKDDISPWKIHAGLAIGF